MELYWDKKMANYTITLSDAEDKALEYAAVDPQEWINNVVRERCRVAMEEIVANYVKEQLAAGKPLSGSTTEEIVLAANVKSAAERNAEAIAQAK
jgi:hypothetical protein